MAHFYLDGIENQGDQIKSKINSWSKMVALCSHGRSQESIKLMLVGMENRADNSCIPQVRKIRQNMK